MKPISPPNLDNAICKVENVPQRVFFYEDRTVPRSKAARQADVLAKSYCNRCSEREVCLEFSLATVQVGGVWGGLNYNERRTLAAERYQNYWREKGLL